MIRIIRTDYSYTYDYSIITKRNLLVPLESSNNSNQKFLVLMSPYESYV